MHISSTLMLIIASIAAGLFVCVFAAAAIITRRNRQIIQEHDNRTVEIENESPNVL